MAFHIVTSSYQQKKITKVDKGKFIIHTKWGRFHEYCPTCYTVLLSRIIWQNLRKWWVFQFCLTKYTWQHSKKTFPDIIKVVAHLLLILTWYAPRSKNMENVACRDLSRISMNIIVRSPETIKQLFLVVKIYSFPESIK